MAVKIKLHRKLKGEEPCEGMELEEVLLNNLVDFMVGKCGGGDIEAVLEGGRRSSEKPSCANCLHMQAYQHH